MPKAGGSKKVGRDKAKCQRYRAEGRRKKNKLRRLMKRIRNVRTETQKRILELNPIKAERERNTGKGSATTKVRRGRKAVAKQHSTEYESV